MTGVGQQQARRAVLHPVKVVVEAETAALIRLSGFSGTTGDAVTVSSDPTGEPAQFLGSSTAVGRTARACVRDALTAALKSQYDSEPIPGLVDDPEYSCATIAEVNVLGF